MLDKAAQELRTIEGNRFFNRPVAIIFGDERDFSIGNIQDALVGNGHAMGVLAQVFYYVFRARQRRFAMCYQFCCAGKKANIENVISGWIFMQFRYKAWFLCIFEPDYV